MTTLVLVHVIISLIAIVAGVIVMFGLLGSRAMPGLTAIFLFLTILTNATGFVIPPLVIEKLLPWDTMEFRSTMPNFPPLKDAILLVRDEKDAPAVVTPEERAARVRKAAPKIRIYGR